LELPSRSSTQVAFGKAKFVTCFSRWVKGQAQGWKPGGFKLWVNWILQPVQPPTVVRHRQRARGEERHDAALDVVEVGVIQRLERELRRLVVLKARGGGLVGALRGLDVQRHLRAEPAVLRNAAAV
jgi:hypothetical protein